MIDLLVQLALVALVVAWAAWKTRREEGQRCGR